MITTSKLSEQGHGTRKSGRAGACTTKDRVIAMADGLRRRCIAEKNHTGGTEGERDSRSSVAVWGDQRVPMPLVAELIGGSIKYTEPKPIRMESGDRVLFLVAWWAFNDFIVLQETTSDRRWNQFRCIPYTDGEAIDDF